MLITFAHVNVECGLSFFFFFQAEDGIRDFHVTGVQTCALPISRTFRIEHGYTIPVFSPYSRVPVYASCSVVPDGPVPPLHAMHPAQVMAYCLFDRAHLSLHSEAAPLPFRLTEPLLHAFDRSGAS